MRKHIESNALNRVVVVVSACIGLNSYYVDPKDSTYRQSRFTRNTALLANVLTVFVLPIVVYNEMHRTQEVQVITFKHPLMIVCGHVYLSIRGLAVLYVVVFRAARERECGPIVEEFIQLRAEYLDKLPPNAAVEAYFNRVFYIKFACFAYLALAEMMEQTMTRLTFTWDTYLLMAASFGLNCMMLMATFIYFMTMWHVCRGLVYANEQLGFLMQRMKHDAGARPQSRQLNGASPIAMRLLCHDMHQLRCVHWKCVTMVERFNHIHRFQIIGLRFTCLTLSVLMGYYGTIFSVYVDTPITMILYGFSTYCIMTLDLYMLDLICDKTVQCYKETGQILKRCNAYSIRSKSLRNLCEAFALHLTSYNLQLSQCGLFVVDMRLWFRMLAALITYTTVLVQYHVVLNLALQKTNRNSN